ncbi:putative nucleolar transformer 2-like protein [Encephalitozoon romaleae SJ-2008]|uniref:Nucleolar transformer 2-like protein n=1 Tax=Encephalitozoon romaleae (strain SJ-2008) TaxID=1178016 RepID=I7AMY1_ENCRO|nr:putative nucleolar transformer 2-like protein [Encephalitozoon romaleae SJ-2008]AFN83109.1 putative nucleolar transformer 2-like protein [Encephalitozoon romaleae SJ-2008]
MEREEKEGKRDVRSKWKGDYSGGNRSQCGKPFYSDRHDHYNEYDGIRRRKINQHQGNFIRYRENGNYLGRTSHAPHSRTWTPRGPYPSNTYETREGRSYGIERSLRGGEEYERPGGHSYRNEKYGLKAKRNGSPSKAIGVFGLGAYITEDDVKNFLKERISGITNYKVVIVYDKYSGLSKGYGFIQFDTLDDAITAKNKLLGQTIKGKEIRIDYSIE